MPLKPWHTVIPLREDLRFGKALDTAEFVASCAEAMKRFLIEEGAGNDPRFWQLAQSFSALYPLGKDEKRWVDGMLERKKGLGF